MSAPPVIKVFLKVFKKCYYQALDPCGSYLPDSFLNERSAFKSVLSLIIFQSIIKREEQASGRPCESGCLKDVNKKRLIFKLSRQEQEKENTVCIFVDSEDNIECGKYQTLNSQEPLLSRLCFILFFSSASLGCSLEMLPWFFLFVPNDLGGICEEERSLKKTGGCEEVKRSTGAWQGQNYQSGSNMIPEPLQAVALTKLHPRIPTSYSALTESLFEIHLVNLPESPSKWYLSCLWLPMPDSKLA